MAAVGQAYVMLMEIHYNHPLMAILAGTIAALMALLATVEVAEE
jgi:hypothetical protein